MNRRRMSAFAAMGLVFLACLIFLFVWLQKPRKHSSQQSAILHPHLYENSQVSLSIVDLKIFYVVPTNLKMSVADNWLSEIKSIEKDVSDFHLAQFHHSSQLNFEIYPSPVILDHDNLYYDTQNTNLGNPQGLRSIAAELESRFATFLQPVADRYLVIAIIYEGVGASGSVGATILSRTFLDSPEYSKVAASLFYHELGHAFGLPDRYDLKTDEAYSDDIMGAGRRKPIRTNYLAPDLLSKLGVTLN